MFCDDSGSMSLNEPAEDNLTRHQILQQIMVTLSFWASLMDADGVCVRFFNSSQEANGVSNANDVNNLLNVVRPSGGTPMGEMMKVKVIDKMVRNLLMSGNLDRPILIITVTDGVPNNPAAVINTITEARNMALQSKYGENAIAFSFAQVGSEPTATAWLEQIDSDPQVGKFIDCTSNFSIERDQCKAKFGIEFTESMWLIKLMVGAVDPAYDGADEGLQTNQPVYGQQQPSYNQQQQQPYGQQQQQPYGQQQQTPYSQQQQSPYNQQQQAPSYNQQQQQQQQPYNQPQQQQPTYNQQQQPPYGQQQPGYNPQYNQQKPPSNNPLSWFKK